MSYNPQIPPQDDKELLPFLSDELNRVAISYNDLQDGFWGVDHNLPLRIRPGIIKIFDGTDANPLGTGRAGVYYFGEDSQWHFLTDNQAVIDIITPILDSFSAAIIAAVVDAIDAGLVTARPTVMTPVATTSGNAHVISGIPTWAKKVTVVLQGVSTTGSGIQLIRLGTGSGLEDSGYLGSTTAISGSTSSSSAHSSGIPWNTSEDAANLTSGSITFVNISGNSWVYSGVLALSNEARTMHVAGSKTLSGNLLGAALITSTAFDAGQFTVIYE